MNIEIQKEIIIEQFKQVNDTKLINAIKNMLDLAKMEDERAFDIPESHQRLVMERFIKVRNNPDRLLDWEEAKNTLKP